MGLLDYLFGGGSQPQQQPQAQSPAQPPAGLLGQRYRAYVIDQQTNGQPAVAYAEWVKQQQAAQAAAAANTKK